MQHAPERRRRPTMSAPLLAMLMVLGAHSAHAQDATADTQPATPADTPAETPPMTEASPSASRAPLPIMVVVVPARRVSEETTQAVAAAVTAQVTPMAGRRPVHALADEAILSAMRACSDDACLGAQLASAQAQAGLVVRVSRTRSGHAASLEMRDPVSGALRGERIEGELPRDAEAIAEAIAPLSAQLEAQMPSPPPPPSTLLVTVNVDGARIQLDGEPLGESPVSRVELSEGPHTVSVAAPGHVPVQRRTEIGVGEQARLDVTLDVLGAEAVEASSGTVGEGAWAMETGEPDDGELLEQWWFWTIVGGGAALLIGVAIGIGVAVSDQGPSMLDPQGIELPPLMGGL
ncbi:MAG: PEGA domain-containing protein [Sandaracinaceae bacterium]